MRHETQMRQLICFSFAKEYGLKMKRQLIIEVWWVWRFFHVQKSDDDLKEKTGKGREDKMDYETFKQEMTEDLKQRLYERGVEDVEMSFHNVEKANQHYCNIPKKVENMNKKYCECSLVGICDCSLRFLKRV